MYSNQLEKLLKLESLDSQEIDELYFYTNMYTAFQQIEKLYKDGYDHKKVFNDITSDVSLNKKYSEYIKLISLQVNILSLLIGLNNESVQHANSKVKGRNLFKYADYKCDAKTIDKYGMQSTVYEQTKKMCDRLGFNPNREGAFPYMLEITKTDDKNRPYDIVSKIRNAMEHGEYCLKKTDINIIDITNHDDNNNLTFAGKLLFFPYRVFVEDFSGYGLGVSSDYTLYSFPNVKEINNREYLKKYLKDTFCTYIIFKEVPNKYQFTGQDALLVEINNCFKNKIGFDKELEKLEKEGVVFEKKYTCLTDDVIDCVIEYVETISNYDDIDDKIINKIKGACKLMFSPDTIISICLRNILRYIDLKKEYLINNEISSHDMFEDLKIDEGLSLGFKYTLMLLKANICNYALENKKLQLNLEELDFSNLMAIPQSYFFDKIEEEYKKSNDPYSMEKVVLTSIRNAIAHGEERIKPLIGDVNFIKFSDIYNNKTLDIIGSLNEFDKIYSSTCFNPENVVPLDKKVKIKK